VPVNDGERNGLPVRQKVVELQRDPGGLGITDFRLKAAASSHGDDVLLRVFTQNVRGPIFFEILQRKGSELDQMRRGRCSTAPL
jgi:hypothetical protein